MVTTFIRSCVMLLLCANPSMASEQTDLSLKAQKMRHELLTKGQVIELLGPPTWSCCQGIQGIGLSPAITVRRKFRCL